MWYSGLKYRKIKTLVNAIWKYLKAILALGVKKLDSFFLTSKLGKFLLFDTFFPNIADF